MQQGDRRIELDRAYKQLMEAVTKAVERCALEHPRTPPDVIRFGELLSTFITCHLVSHVTVQYVTVCSIIHIHRLMCYHITLHSNSLSMSQ